MNSRHLKAALETSLQGAFRQCETAGIPLTELQKQMIQQVTQSLLMANLQTLDAVVTQTLNPLDELTVEQRTIFLDYIQSCDRTGEDWKMKLLNDWLQNRDSGSVQFIRDRYGLPWLNRVQTQHLAVYADTPSAQVKLGDRLEVCDRLWEWIPESELGDQQWYACTVVRIFETTAAGQTYMGCTVRFENGNELDIEGLYDWNQPNWRWPQSASDA